MINFDFSRKTVINTRGAEWVETKTDGVRRILLCREAAESGHATSIVQYAPGARFSQHSHPLGEEILVLEGTFSDEYGDYPKGSYLRNPPGSHHAPYSENGCLLFVKLNQFLLSDRQPVAVNTLTATWLPGQGNLRVLPLHTVEGEHTALVKWPAGERFGYHRHYGGEEILVLSGKFLDEHGEYPAGTWLRSPHMSAHLPYTDEETVIWVKVGHLPV